ncbi:MAG: SPASM domain-containing protein [Oscillospiraceae bacterium]
MRFNRIYIEITNICNLNCTFCSPCNRKKEFMSVENFEHIINKIKPYSPHIYLHVKGEPLIHPDLSEFLQIAALNNLPVNITTNGTMIKNCGEMLLNSSAVRQVNISVHSLGEQELTEHSAYLKEISNFGFLAAKNKKPYVSYRMWNGEKNEGISQEALSQLNAIAEVFNTKLDGDKMAKGRDAGTLAENVFISFMEEFEWPNLSLPKVSERGKCLGGREMLGILVDGTVVPCCLDSDAVVNLGNIFEKTLEEILETQRYKNLRDGFTGGNISEELCQKCSYRLRFDKNKKGIITYK